MPILVLFLLFTALPVIELSLLLRVGERLGVGPTVGLVLLTGVVGAALARWQGLRALRRIQEALQTGQMPTQALFDGALILVAGTLLVTPGVLTDAVGFALLVPVTRRLLGKLLRRWAAARFQVHTGPLPSRPAPPDVFDAEVLSSGPAPPPPPVDLDHRMEARERDGSQGA